MIEDFRQFRYNEKCRKKETGCKKDITGGKNALSKDCPIM